MFMRSERLFLRPAWPEDAQDLHTLHEEAQVACGLQRDACDITRLLAPRGDRRHPSLLITLPGARESRLIGYIGVHQDDGEAVLRIFLAPDVRGRGYAREALAAFLRLIRTLGHGHVSARNVADGSALARLLQHTGFVTTGRVVAHLDSDSCPPSREYVLAFDSPGLVLEGGEGPGKRAA